VTVRPTTRPTALTFRALWRPVTPSTNVRSRCATRSPSTLRVYTRLTYLFFRRQIRGERSKLPPDQPQRELVEPRPLLLQPATSASTSSPRLAIEDQPESGVKIMRAARAPRPSPARWVLHAQGRPGGSVGVREGTDGHVVGLPRGGTYRSTAAMWAPRGRRCAVRWSGTTPAAWCCRGVPDGAPLCEAFIGRGLQNTSAPAPGMTGSVSEKVPSRDMRSPVLGGRVSEWYGT
jgi:hypothetical protein